MFSLRSLFGTISTPAPRIRVVHDYRRQWDGHRVLRTAVGPDAYVTGKDIVEGDHIVLDDGTFEAEIVMPFTDSDLYMCRLRMLP